MKTERIKMPESTLKTIPEGTYFTFDEDSGLFMKTDNSLDGLDEHPDGKKREPDHAYVLDVENNMVERIDDIDCAVTPVCISLTIEPHREITERKICADRPITINFNMSAYYTLEEIRQLGLLVPGTVIYNNETDDTYMILHDPTEEERFMTVIAINLTTGRHETMRCLNTTPRKWCADTCPVITYMEA